MNTRLALIILTLLTALPGWAKINYENTVPVVMPQQKLPGDSLATELNDASKGLAPAQPTDSASGVGSKIGDKILQNWMNSPDVANTSFMQSANRMQKSMTADVHLGSSGGDDESSAKPAAKNAKGAVVPVPATTNPNKVDHKVTFQFQALQATAKMEYTGWIKAGASYNVGSHTSEVGVSQSIGKNKDLTLTHTASSDNDLSAVGLRWGF